METTIDNLLADSHEIILRDAEDAIAVMETGLPGMIFTLADIDSDFFDLKNGQLGDTFQKFVNYRFPIAIVLPEDHSFGLRITELAREHARHSVVRFFVTLADAKNWMTQVISR